MQQDNDPKLTAQTRKEVQQGQQVEGLGLD